MHLARRPVLERALEQALLAEDVAATAAHRVAERLGADRAQQRVAQLGIVDFRQVFGEAGPGELRRLLAVD